MAPSMLHLPADLGFIDNLILQRTGPFIELGGSAALSHWFQTGQKSQLSMHLTRNNLLSAYLQKLLALVELEIDEFCKFTRGHSFKHLVSIGPGNGLFELLLYKRTPFEKLLLVDIEETPSLHQHGYSAQGSGYASLAATSEFLTQNGIPRESLFLCNPSKSALPTFPHDLLISVLSMGFHYPCVAYAEFILANLTESGLAVFDQRKGVRDTGFDLLVKKLTLKDAVDSPKSCRYFLMAERS
jgi:hypothetical protein